MKLEIVNLFLFLTLFTCTLAWDLPFYLTATKNGIVKGTKQRTTTSNKSYYSYFGIPFAKPPIGNLRFEPPVPVGSWSGILDATKQKNICPQGFQLTVKADKLIGSEDCLYLNIYTPLSPGEAIFQSPLPVMVWIYGGGFFEGENTYTLYGSDLFIDENIILVSISYRLGIFGFYSTGDLVAPGNNGLKDQILALQWVHDNIRAFGGDPNRVTIAGESAGSASVSLLTQTPLTRGLYSGAIMQSGTSQTPWAISTRASTAVYDTAALLGINYTSTLVLKNRLKLVDWRQLLAMSTIAYSRLVGSNPVEGLALAPVIEPDQPGAVVNRTSDDVLNSGDFNWTPMLIGYNSMEGVDFPLQVAFTTYLNIIQLASEGLVPTNFNITDTVVLKEVGDILKTYYFGDLSAVAFTDYQYIPYLSDMYFIVNAIQTAQIASRFTKVFFYEFSFLGQLGNPLRPYNLGVGHAEDLNYLFTRSTTSPPILSDAEQLTRLRLVRLWTNFVKTGNPTPNIDPLLQNVTWPNIDENLNYLDIGDDLVPKVNPREAQYNLWMGLYAAYRNY